MTEPMDKDCGRGEIPLFFPFSDISPETLLAVEALFCGVGILLPCREFLTDPLRGKVDACVVHPFYPEEEIARQVFRLRRHLTDQAAALGKAGLAALLGETEGRPEDPFHLSREIMGETVFRPEGEAEKNRLLGAAVFLLAAAEYDLQKVAVDLDFAKVAATEKKMMAILQGKTGDTTWDTPPVARTHLPERLRAWAQLCLSTGVADRVWVTDDEDVIRELQEVFPSMRKKEDITFSSSERDGSGTWYAINGLSPRHALGCLARYETGGTGRSEGEKDLKILWLAQ